MILITGGTGFLGSKLIQELTSKQIKVRAVKREQSKIPTILKNNLNIDWYDADINDPETLADAFEGISQVYHCAAHVSFLPKDKSKMFHVNISGTANIVNLCLEYGCRLLHVSSVAALGDAKNGLKISEKDLWEFNTNSSAYAISKYEGEMEVWRGIAEGLNAVIVNPSVILGKEAGFEGSGAIFKLIKNGFPFYTEGATGMVDVDDVVKAMIILMNSPITEERYIISSQDINYKELFKNIAEGFSVKAPTKEAKPWMLELAWRSLKFFSLFTGAAPSITKDTARSSVTFSYYNNEKIINTTGIKFKPVAQSILEITQHLKNA